MRKTIRTKNTLQRCTDGVPDFVQEVGIVDGYIQARLFDGLVVSFRGEGVLPNEFLFALNKDWTDLLAEAIEPAAREIWEDRDTDIAYWENT